MTDHVFRHRCLGNPDTQFQEFTANPRHAPDDVLAAHGSNQLTSFPRNLRPSRSAVTTLGQLMTERNDFGLKPGLLAKAGEHNTKRY